MTLVNPGNPNTSSFAIADIRDGSPLDAALGSLGAAVHYERLDVADPAPNSATDIANTRLGQLAGAVHTMTVNVVPQPWLSIGDVVLVVYNGTQAVGQVAGWAWTGDDMTVTLRGWRVASDWDLPVSPTWEAGRVSINAALPIGVDPAPEEPVPVPPESPVETS